MGYNIEFTYKIKLDGHLSDQKRSIFAPPTSIDCPEKLAQSAAFEYYHEVMPLFNFSKAKWPDLFMLYDNDGEKLGEFEVEYELEPMFYAMQKA